MEGKKGGDEFETVRLFIGIRPDRRTQQFLDGLVSHTRQAPGTGKRDGIRWTSHSNRHLTLAFLGETPISQVPAIEERLQLIAEQSIACHGRIVGLTPFPKRRSRLLAAELLPNPALDKLHEHCRQLMIILGMKPEGAAYRPHFTLARNKRGFSRLEPLAVDFTAKLDNLTLYQSLMTPGGSQYRPLLEVALEDTPAE